MAYPSWMIKKKYSERNEKPFHKMKDRDMTGVEVVFECGAVQFQRYHKLLEIKQPSNKITMNYIANLAGRRGVNKYWTHHGGGGWVTYLTLGESEFDRVNKEIKRLGGKVSLKFNFTM